MNRKSVWQMLTKIHEVLIPFLFFHINDVSKITLVDVDGDPRDGGWSDWGAWTCSVSCNGGIGTRRRYCNNPEPNVKGEPCLGPSTMTGRCNTIICGDLLEGSL